MSVQNAMNAMQAWAQSSGISSDGRDLSPFVTGGTLIALADAPASHDECDVLSQIKMALTGSDLSWEDFQKEVEWINSNGTDGAINTIAQNITDNGERELLVKFAALVGVAEKGLNAQEGSMLQKLGQGLGFSHNRVLELLGQAMNAASHGQFLSVNRPSPRAAPGRHAGRARGERGSSEKASREQPTKPRALTSPW